MMKACAQIKAKRFDFTAWSRVRRVTKPILVSYLRKFYTGSVEPWGVTVHPKQVLAVAAVCIVYSRIWRRPWCIILPHFQMDSSRHYGSNSEWSLVTLLETITGTVLECAKIVLGNTLVWRLCGLPANGYFWRLSIRDLLCKERAVLVLWTSDMS